MKQLTLILFFSFSIFSAVAQVTTAMDWTKTDCVNGTEYTLFDILETNKVVVQEYVMMDCAPCITAGNVLMNLLEDYEALYPGAIVAYQTVYEDFTDCSTLVDWATENEFSNSTLFTNGNDEINYYGSMGMPTILIFGGGATHSVFYYHLGSISSAAAQDEFTTALNTALASSGVNTGITTTSDNTIQIAPNPAQNELSVSLLQNATVIIYDITGKIIAQYADVNNTTIDISLFTPGVYYLQAVSDLKIVTSASFIKQ